MLSEGGLRKPSSMYFVFFVVTLVFRDISAEISSYDINVARSDSPSEIARHADAACSQKQGSSLLQRSLARNLKFTAASAQLANKTSSNFTNNMNHIGERSHEMAGNINSIVHNALEEHAMPRRALVKGSLASLTEEGYKSVSKSRSNHEMAIFIQRVIEGMGGRIMSEAAFNGVVPYYSGKRAVQSLKALKQEILTASRNADTWVKIPAHKSQNEDSPVVASKSKRAVVALSLDSAIASEKFADRDVPSRSLSAAPLADETEIDEGLHKDAEIVGVPSRSLSAAPLAERTEIDEELHKDAEIVSARGSTAPLNEEGYKMVSKLRNNDEMSEFMHRVVREMGGCIIDDASFNGVVPFYSGKRATQSFEALRKEILSTQQNPDSWVEIVSDTDDEGGLDGLGTKASLASTSHSVGMSKKIPGDNKEPIWHTAKDGDDDDDHGGLDVLGRKASLASTLHGVGMSKKVPQDNKDPILHTAKDETTSIRGSTAELDEEGYNLVSKLTSDAEMAAFILRVVTDMGGSITDEAGFEGVVPYYSGARATQSLGALRNEILLARKAPHAWVRLVEHGSHVAGPRDIVTGRPIEEPAAWQNATSQEEVKASVSYLEQEAGSSSTKQFAGTSLDEAGYKSVAKLKNNHKMGDFVKRAVANMGLRIVDESGLKGLVPFYSGKRATQSFDALEQEIRRVSEEPGSWIEVKRKPAEIAKQSEQLNAISNLQTAGSSKALTTEPTTSANQSSSQNSFLKLGHWQVANTTLLDRASTREALRRNLDGDYDTDVTTGSLASLDEAGYKTVSESGSDAAMSVFIERLLTSMGGNIADEAGFLGVIPYFSGQRATQSFEALKNEISSAFAQSDGWVKIDESAASLDETGYEAVAVHKSNQQMESFVRRLADKMNVKIVDEAGLRGILPYFSGEKTTQSFEALSQEIRSAADSDGAWASH